jgi:deoxycytidylate deaminase
MSRWLATFRGLFENHPADHRCKHVAIIHRGGTLVAVGYNRAKTHPLQARFSTGIHKLHLHAEIDAIANALRQRIPLTECSLIVARQGPKGFMTSRPCDGCWSALEAFGVRTVGWTTAEGIVEFYNLQENAA